MSKLGAILGTEYQKNVQELLTKSIRIGEMTLKIRIPTVLEQELMNKRMIELDEKKIQEVYEQKSADLMKFKGTEDVPDWVEYTDNDIIVQGKSMRESVRTGVAVETRIMEALKLIVPDEGHDWSEVTYDDIQAEWPFEAQVIVVTKIFEAINPSYSEIKEK